jgi:hypothetical protein
MYETEYARLCRLQRMEREHAQAIYGPWRHPDNVAWAQARDVAGARSVKEHCRAVENRLRDVERQAQNRQRAADSGGSFYTAPMICHPGRPGMSIRDREWLVAPENRDVVKRLWSILLAGPRTIMGGIGSLTTDELDDAGLRETLIAHWRDVQYAEDGSRQESIPGSVMRRDLELLGLSREAVENGTVKQPPRPAAASRPQAPPTSRRSQPAAPTVPFVIRRRGEGVARGR